MERLIVIEISIPKKVILKEWNDLTRKWFSEKLPLFKPNKKSNYFETLLSLALLARVKADLPQHPWDEQTQLVTKLESGKETFVLQIVQLPKVNADGEDMGEVFFQKIGKEDAIFKFESRN